MRSKQLIVTLFVLATGCVTERPQGDDEGEGSGSGSGSSIDPSWLPSKYVAALASDDTHVYFSSDGDKLSRVSLGGGEPEVLYTAPVASGNGSAWVTSIHLGPSDVAFVVDESDFMAGTQKRALMTIPKAGGTAKQLSMSQDSRSYLGVTIEGSFVYFSTFTALLRVPIAGGTVDFVGESPNSVRYWAFSPTIIAGQLYWAESTGIYRIAATATDDEGTLFASMPGGATILGTTSTSLVVGVSEPFGLYDPSTKFAQVDLASGSVSAPIAFGGEVEAATVAGNDIYATTFNGLVRVPLAGGAPVQLTTEYGFAVTATDHAVFVGTDTGITRIAL